MIKPFEPYAWRVVGKSGDGQAVTLGKYHTREQAEADYEKHVRTAYYRELAIHPIQPPPKPQPE